MFRPIVIVLALILAAPVHAQTSTESRDQGQRQNRAQPRAHGQKVPVPLDKIVVDDGDTVDILWGGNDREVIRILGIDTPEIAHPEHDLPYPQSFGYEAMAFAKGAFAAATKVELLRASTLDPYGRTLGYLFINGMNYSPLIVRARLAEESVSRYGDNGLPEEAAKVLAAAKEAGPMPFESPGSHRRRMREVSRWLKETGARAH